MDEPSAQLHLELRDFVARSLTDRRPILHHLNADTSWLLQIPRPLRSTKHSKRVFYNILIDPWLSGGQSDVAPWFSQQWHAIKPSVESIAQVEELARELEILAGGLRLGKSRVPNADEPASKTFIDCVAISHEFTDHAHRDTLLQVDSDVPVFATEKAASLISSWSHFRTVVNIPALEASPALDWRTTSLPPLPEWLSITRLQSPGNALYYHSALLIAFLPPHVSAVYASSSSSRGKASTNQAEAVVYTPHGIQADDIPILADLNPGINCLALLHGLHDVSLRVQQLNLGGHNGLKAQRRLRAKYWIGTHDEVKKGGGIVSWFLNRKIISLEEAIKQERQKLDLLNGTVQPEDQEDGEWDNVQFMELKNGESLVLR